MHLKNISFYFFSDPMLNLDPNWNPRRRGMEVLFIMSSLLCGHQKPLMKPLMKSLIKPLLLAVWCATHEPLMKRLQGFFPLMKPLMIFPCATHEHS